MTGEKVRLNVRISKELDQLIEEISDESEITRTEVVRRALAVMKAFREQRRQGRRHIGFANDPEKLDAEILNVL